MHVKNSENRAESREDFVRALRRVFAAEIPRRWRPKRALSGGQRCGQRGPRCDASRQFGECATVMSHQNGDFSHHPCPQGGAAAARPRVAQQTDPQRRCATVFRCFRSISGNARGIDAVTARAGRGVRLLRVQAACQTRVFCAAMGEPTACGGSARRPLSGRRARRTGCEHRWRQAKKGFPALVPAV